VETTSLIGPDGAPAGGFADLADEELLRLYRGMVRIRVMDSRLLNMQRQGRIGFYGTATGEEAAVIGSVAAFRPTDWIFPALRQGGALVYRGFPAVLYVAQCIGNAMDPLKGRQMPCHASARAQNVVAWSSVIGTQLSQAAGAAIAAKIRGDDTVIAGYLGDGATSTPEFHVALNFAAVRDAPVVFLCQNNQWAISVPFRKQTAAAGIAEKAVAYGIPGVRVDGNDVLAVYAATREAVERARGGGGPTLLELLTYRRRGHSSSDDPTRYRDEAEVTEWEARDPIERFAARLGGRGLLDGKGREEIEREISAEIGDAIREAEAGETLTAESLFDDVYAERPASLREQAEAVRGRRAGDREWEGAFPL
jgi:pyruvate dehydrogenase E1 component alpha subunit/2-oxoisovalerate dehydrogenase E1 component alpha subunit